MFTPTEVIPFFKTLKEHFVGVQTTLFKEVKEMEEIFDQMNNEVDKNTVDKQCAEIEKKNLLIENKNLIVNCLSTQLLYDVEKSRCLDLEADMSSIAETGSIQMLPEITKMIVTLKITSWTQMLQCTTLPRPLQNLPKDFCSFYGELKIRYLLTFSLRLDDIEQVAVAPASDTRTKTHYESRAKRFVQLIFMRTLIPILLSFQHCGKQVYPKVLRIIM
ncbi:hypothetical protein Tco_0782731 [Tanacetum coccineum]